jgi:hypothetical protein
MGDLQGTGAAGESAQVIFLRAGVAYPGRLPPHKSIHPNNSADFNSLGVRHRLGINLTCGNDAKYFFPDHVLPLSQRLYAKRDQGPNQEKLEIFPIFFLLTPACKHRETD